MNNTFKKLSMKSIIAILLSTACLTANVQAKEINLDNETSNALSYEIQNGFLDNLTDEIIIKECNPFLFESAVPCRFNDIMCTTNQSLFRAMYYACKSKIEDGQIEFNFEDFQLTDQGAERTDTYDAAIPEKVESKKWVGKNCSSLVRTLNEVQSYKSSEESSITSLDHVKTASEQSLEANINLDDKLGVINMGSKESVTVDFSEEQTQSYLSEESTTVSMSEDIPPYTALVITNKTTFSLGYIDFKGYLGVDATIYHNGNNYGRISDYVELDPIEVEGEIWNAESTFVEKEYLEIQLPVDVTSCDTADLSMFGTEI